MTTSVADAFVGRARELEAAAARLAEGRGGVLLITGEAGIGKTRLAREIAGQALATGIAVVWGRCVEGEGAPPYWPWRQVVRSLGTDPDTVFGGGVESPEERFRLVDSVHELLVQKPLVVVLDDLHVADEASLSLLRHVAGGLLDQPLLVVATAREAGPDLTDLTRTPGADRWDLRRLDLSEVEQLAPDHAEDVHRATDGNPLFVRELARAIADGTWDPGRPPRTVLDAVTARLDRLTPQTKLFLQLAAVAGRDVPLDVVAAALGNQDLLPLVDEAVGHGLLEDGPRFVHALTRDAVELSLTQTELRDAHERLGRAVHDLRPGDVGDLMRHALGAGDTTAARDFAVRGAEQAFEQLAFEDAARLFRVALDREPHDLRALHGLARSAYYAGDLDTWVDAVKRAADLSRGTRHLADVALLLEAVPQPGVNALADALCLEALEQDVELATRARLLSLRSNVAYYAGDRSRTGALSAEAVEGAHDAQDDEALATALRSRWEALAGPAGLEERTALVDELLPAAQRLGSRRNEMWARLWRIEVRCERADIAGAQADLPALAEVCALVGGPVAGWHLDRVSACVAQAGGRYDEAVALSARGLERMARVEPAPARGAWFGLQVSLAQHGRVEQSAVAAARQGWDPPPRFVTMGRLSRATLLALAGDLDAARALHVQLGAPSSWDLPAFFELPGLGIGVTVAELLGRSDQLEELVTLLEPWRGRHLIGGGVAYGGPVTLALGKARAALGQDATADLRSAIAETAAAPAHQAEARLRLAALLPPGAEKRELQSQGEQVARALGLTALLPRSTATVLSAREEEVAALVAEGLSNRQIAERLFLSERTAQNHVQHILTKLDLSNRAQVAAWWMSR